MASKVQFPVDEQKPTAAFLCCPSKTMPYKDIYLEIASFFALSLACSSICTDFFLEIFRFYRTCLVHILKLFFKYMVWFIWNHASNCSIFMKLLPSQLDMVWKAASTKSKYTSLERKLSWKLGENCIKQRKILVAIDKSFNSPQSSRIFLNRSFLGENYHQFISYTLYFDLLTATLHRLKSWVLEASLQHEPPCRYTRPIKTVYILVVGNGQITKTLCLHVMRPYKNLARNAQ